MSQSNIQAKIRSNPKFAELVGKRTRFAVILSLVVLVPYYTYMLLVSLQPQLFAGKISDGSVITIGWPIAALIVVGGWLLTGVYVSRANGEFDRLTEEVMKEASQMKRSITALIAGPAGPVQCQRPGGPTPSKAWRKQPLNLSAIACSSCSWSPRMGIT
jgi:uncharacterized membrane protein (DUF485 family)